MVTNTDFTFNTSLSVDNYFSKAECTAAIAGTREDRKELGIKLKIGFQEKTVTAQDLLNYTLNGHTYCNLFNGYNDVYAKNQTYLRKTDNAFTMSAKQDMFFKGSYTISIDIDEVNNYSTISEFISDLSMKPTFYVTSYNHLQPNKGLRFRLVYVFDELIKGNDYGWYYRYVASKVSNVISKDTNENIDTCSLKCSQYFNGTNINNKDLNVEYGITNIIYSFSDFDIKDYDYYLFLKNDKTKINKDKKNIKEELIRSYTTYYNDLQKCATPENEEKVSIKSENIVESDNTVISPNLLSDMARLDYDEFMKYNRHKYNYFYRYENYNWIECNGFKWAYIDNNYLSLYWNVNTVKDGCKRRKKVFERMCLRRLINNEVDADTLAFNAYEDIHRFFDNSDNLLNVDYIKRNVERCFELSLSEINEMYSNNIEYLKSLKPKNGKIFKFYTSNISFKNSSIKDINKQEIMGYYNTDMTIKENIEYLNKWGISVSEKTLYTYLNEMGLSNKDIINRDKETKEEYIKSLINDTNCSVRKFRITLNELNIKLSDKKLREYIKEYKEGLGVDKNSTTYYNDLQKTATPIFEENDNIKSESLSNSNISFNGSLSTTYYNELQFCGQSISEENDNIKYEFSTNTENINKNNDFSLDYNEIEKEGLRLFNQYYTNYNNYYY